MENLTTPVNLENSSEYLKERKTSIQTTSLEALEKNISITEHHSFTALVKQFLNNVKDKFSNHTLKKKNSHYLESLFLSKVSENNLSNKKRVVSKKFQSLLELKKEERGSWIEEILKRDKSENRDPLWEQIKTLSSIIFMEQIVDLALICESNHSSEFKEPLSNLLNFSLQLARLMPQNNSSKNSKTIKEAQEVIGKIIFIAERSPLSLKEITDEEPGKILSFIHEEFLKQKEVLQKDLLKYSELHQKTQLQSPQAAYWNKLSLNLAKMLITEKGSINIGIIDLFIQDFASLNTYPYSYQKSIIRGLKQLRDNPLVRVYLEKIYAPEKSDFPTNEIIRASLGLDLNAKILDIHAKQAVIAALFAHPRQSSSTSCFATSFVIKMEYTHPLHCIKDYGDLLSKGKLTRTVNGISKDIPFLKHIEDNLNIEVEFNAEGQITLNGLEEGYIWEAPGIQSACRAIGISEIKTAIMQIVDEEFSTKEEAKIKLKIKKILKKLAGQIISEKDDSKLFSILYSKTCFAFSSEIAQPLSKVWENCIAGMSEAAERSMIKSKILESFIYSLEVELNRLEVPVTEEIKEFLEKTQQILKQTVQLRYDPSLEYEREKEKKVTHSGAFVLYNQSFRIDNSSGFCKFSKELIEIVHKKLTEDNKEDKYKYFKESFLSYIGSSAFLKNMLTKYRSKRLSKSHNSQSTLAPWITYSGNNSRRVMDVYFESENAIKIHSLTTKNSIEFAASLIQLGKQIFQDKKNFLANSRIAGRIHYSHAFTGTFNDPLLYNAITSSIAPQKWIEKNIIQTGSKIASSKIGSESQKRILESLKKDILSKFLSQEQSEQFCKQIEKLNVELTIKEYRNEILQLFENLELLKKLEKNQFSLTLDSCICNSLEPKMKEKFLQSVLYFSDTNWSQGSSDVFFCLLINPGNGKLEIWHSQDNEECFTRLNQEEWLINKQWEFFTVPNDYHSDSQIFKIYD